jgi:hypothetical protein
MRPRVKSTCRARDLDDVDMMLECAIDELRTCCGRLEHGRIHLWVDVDLSRAIGHELGFDRETSEDIARVMRAKPRKETPCR